MNEVVSQELQSKHECIKPFCVVLITILRMINGHLTCYNPVLDITPVTPNGRVQVGSFLSVLLDTPAPTPLTLASHPIKVSLSDYLYGMKGT